MATPQKAIFVEESNQFYFLEYTLHSQSSLQELKQAIRQSLEVSKYVKVVIGFGKKGWDRMQPGWEPEELEIFPTLQGVHGFMVPSTQRDIFFWIHGQSQSHNFDQVLKIQNHMSSVAKLELDLPGFRYHDSRDLTGFVDGSANPKADQRQLAALVPEHQVGAGGSYLLSQKWVHNREAFLALPQDDQEKVIGRTKPDSIELEGEAMPPNSHVSRTDVKVGGKAMKIYRRSAPYGSATEHGLYFLAFACELFRHRIQLERMFGMTEDGLYDQLIEYSTPATSSYWFAPSLEDLETLLSH